MISVDNHVYAAHRLAWLYMTGRWPDRHIDHKNLVRDDNRFENLREATPNENMHNRGVQKNNRSGFKGVRWMPNRGPRAWQANLKQGGKQRLIGYFATAEEASAAYTAAAQALRGEFARA